MQKNIGSIIRSDNSGLGILAGEFYENGIINKVIICPNNVYHSFNERFDNSKVGLTSENIEWLLKDLDVLFCFETPFKYRIVAEAKKREIKTILMPMHEGLTEKLPIGFDLYACPSKLEMELDIEPKIFLPVPVNTKKIKWRLRKKAKVFIHNSGHGGIAGRNGTWELLEAMKYVKSDIKLIIRSQYHQFKTDDPRIECRYENIKDYWDLWNDGDVFIFPEKFNGLSLPVQEAFASGMCVMTTDKEAFDFLPKKPLLKPEKYIKIMIARQVDSAVHNAKDIAKKIDEIANTDITEYSLAGKEWAEQNSWNELKNKYLEICKK